MYNLQKNTAIFDDAQLYREHFGQRLTYDDYGRLTKSVDSMGRATTYEYVAAKRPEVKKITYADGTTTTYNYDSTTRRLLSVTDANSKVTTYSYDSNKNNRFLISHHRYFAVKSITDKLMLQNINIS